MNRVILSASTDETILAVTRQHKLVDLEIEHRRFPASGDGGLGV